MDLTIRPLTLRLREPLRTAYGEVRRRELLIVRLEAGSECGIGEAAPLAPYDGVALEDVRAELEGCRGLVAELGPPASPEDRTALLAAVRGACMLPQAAAALDVAVWDLAAKRAGRPVAALLHRDPLSRVAVNATIGADTPPAARAAAAAAAERGAGCIKVKAGTGDDEPRVAAARAGAGPDVAIRLDANGAWPVDGAEAALARLAPFGIEICEEPVSGLAAFRALAGRSSGIPVAMDETAADPGALASGASAFVCLKLSRSGGISGLLEDARAARAAGSRVYLASTLDGPVGIAAAVHAAAAIRPDAPSGLATLGLFTGLDDPFPPQAGTIGVPSGPGLGADRPG